MSYDKFVVELERRNSRLTIQSAFGIIEELARHNKRRGAHKTEETERLEAAEIISHLGTWIGERLQHGGR